MPLLAAKNHNACSGLRKNATRHSLLIYFPHWVQMISLRDLKRTSSNVGRAPWTGLRPKVRRRNSSLFSGTQQQSLHDESKTVFFPTPAKSRSTSPFTDTRVNCVNWNAAVSFILDRSNRARTRRQSLLAALSSPYLLLSDKLQDCDLVCFFNPAPNSHSDSFGAICLAFFKFSISSVLH